MSINVREAIQWAMEKPWRMPVDLPLIEGINTLSVDTETYDPKLKTEGAGFVYKNAHVIGVSLATDNGSWGYYPMRHVTGNCEMPVRMWLRVVLSNPDVTVVMANARYDVEALWSMGIEIKSKIVDIQVTEALLDENERSYSLDSIAKRYGYEGKNKQELEDRLAKDSKGKPDYTRIRELDPVVVGPYAEIDALLTLGIHMDQLEKIKKEQLETVFELESNMIPILMDMRIRGIKVDMDQAQLHNDALKITNELMLNKIHEFSPGLNPFSSQQLGELLGSKGIVVPQTEKGNDSVSNEFLGAQNDELCKWLAEYRKTEKIRRDFIQSMILEGSFEGRLHPQWFQTRGSSFMSGDDTAGTRSGRIACMNPNLAQIPARHPTLGPLVRKLFVPEDGEIWFKGDYSQQEPRISLHYAVVLGLPGAVEMRDMYVNDPSLDYHQIVTDWINKIRSEPINRRQGKDMNLGILYGMGKKKMADKLGLKQSVSEGIIADFHRALPFIRPLQQRTMDLATSRGYVKTILGRKRHFDEWEPINYQRGKFPIKGKEAAQKAYGQIRRSGIHKSLNSIVQGTAAEQMKKAMIQLHREGYKMLVTLYDELGISIQREGEAMRIKEIMETIIPFQVPHLVQPSMGKSWGGASYGDST